MVRKNICKPTFLFTTIFMMVFSSIVYADIEEKKLAEEVNKAIKVTENTNLKGGANIYVVDEDSISTNKKKKKEKFISEYDKRFAGIENRILIKRKPYYNLLSKFDPKSIVIDKETNTIAKDTSFREVKTISVSNIAINTEQPELKKPVTEEKINFQKKAGVSTTKNNKISTNNKAETSIATKTEQQEKTPAVKKPNFFVKSYNSVKKKFVNLFKKFKNWVKHKKT